MKGFTRAIALLAGLLASPALAKPCHWTACHGAPCKKARVAKKAPERRIVVIRRETEPPAPAAAAVAVQPPPTQGVTEISLDAGAGKTLKQLLLELGADVEWESSRLERRVATGNFQGSREIIAQKLLEDFNFAIFHDQSRLRVIVMNTPPRDGVRASAAPQNPTGVAPAK
ncbi:MAG: hypothetical protein ACR652_02505 [Methylocystis sp.]|uniref:hypothetical protein n=1 Tax=Methylocystis sp. TaxID=1911079 RepID=UPI003DA409B2